MKVPKIAKVAVTTTTFLWPWDTPGELGPELSETLTQYTTIRSPSLALGSNTKTQRKQLKETQRIRNQEPTLPLYLPNSGFDDLRPLVNRLSTVTHISHCVTTSRHAAATQTIARLSPTMYPMVFLCWMPMLPQPSLSGLGDWLRISWLTYPRLD